MKKIISTLVVVFSMALSSIVFPVSAKGLTADEVKAEMKKRFPSLNISLISDSKLPGFYAAEADGDLIYITKDARYFIQGQVIDMEKRVNLNREQVAKWNKLKSPMRKKDIASLDEKDMVIFKAPNEKHVVTIFTDIDCGYCRKLHKERQDYLDRGITIRYLGFPRAGLNSASGKKLKGIWCSKDPKKAMTDAKLKRIYVDGSCETPIPEHMKMVRKFGLSGTPSIVLENGDLIGGYQPAEIMLQNLQNAKSKKSD